MNIKRQAIFWSCLFLTIVGFTLHIHQLFAMAASLACLPVIARLLGSRKLEHLEAQRRAPQAVNCGETVDVDLAVRNTGRTRKIFFSVLESLPPALCPGGVQEFPVAILGPGEQTTLRYTLQTTRRGAYALGPAHLQTGDVIGLQQYRRGLPGVHELLVYPQAVHLPYAWPTSAGGRQPVRARRRRRGEGDEFYGVRDYVPGDDPRRISWKTTARRGELTVVEYEQLESLQGVILLDTERRWHAGAGDRHALEYGVTLAASLIEQAYDRGSSVGFIAGGMEQFNCMPLPELDQRLRLYEALARVEAESAEPLAGVLAAHQHLLPPQATVAVISPSPEAEDVAMHLRGLGHTVAWFVLEAGSFGMARPPDYAPLLATLAAARCSTRVILGDRPLAASWGRHADGPGGERHAVAQG